MPAKKENPKELVDLLRRMWLIRAFEEKVSALYAERFDDPVVLQAVEEVEALTTGLSRKIWQKIVILGEPTQRQPAPIR